MDRRKWKEEEDDAQNGTVVPLGKSSSPGTVIEDGSELILGSEKGPLFSPFMFLL